jgi:DNA-directed RNA polymerase subunit RPC12/RpoP
MTAVVLRASGYTWKCPECGRENYTGPAPAAVRCKGCNGEFEVKELHHRRVEAEQDKSNGKEVRKTEILPLFAAAPPIQAEDDIPF